MRRVPHTPPPQLLAALPCPACGYDLRGTAFSPGATCPECGTRFPGPITASRIPWVHRRHRGRVRSLFKTLAFGLHPKQFSAETVRRLSVSEARGFHRLCVFLAVAIVAPGIAMGLWNNRNNHDMHGFDWSAPLLVLLDRGWAILPWALGSFVGLSLSLAVYRRMAAVGLPPGQRRRLVPLAFYASARVLVEWPLLWLITAQIGSTQYYPHWAYSVSPWPEFVARALACVAGLAFALPTAGLVLAAASRRRSRTALLFLVYPVLHVAILVVSLMLTMWAAGFVAIACRSMFT
jgi:hypothetical protein